MATDYFERKLDDKRRLTIPAELRAELASGVVVTRGFHKYLHLYPLAVWNEQVESQLAGQCPGRAYCRLDVHFAWVKTEALLDEKQGRITLEQHLLDYAGIDRDVIAVRAGRYWRLQAA